MTNIILTSVLTWLDRVVYKSQQYVIALKKSLPSLWRFVYHQSPKHKNEIDKVGNLVILEAAGFQGILQTLYSGSGVGVYQGEAITIQEWKLSNPPHWVVGKLRSSDAHLFGIHNVCELLQTAFVLAHHLQSASAKNDLQSRVGKSLSSSCSRAKPPELTCISSSEILDDSLCPLRFWQEELEQLLEHPNHKGHLCPFERIIELLRGGVNHNRGEPGIQKGSSF